MTATRGSRVASGSSKCRVRMHRARCRRSTAWTSAVGRSRSTKLRTSPVLAAAPGPAIERVVLPVHLRREHVPLDSMRNAAPIVCLTLLKGAAHAFGDQVGLPEIPSIAGAYRPPRVGSSLTSSPGHPLRSSSQARVSSLSAAICDVPETTRLLARVPQAADSLSEKLAEPLLFQHWDDSAQCAIWIVS